MWTMWLFSPPVDDRLHHTRYLVFYIACGVAASVNHVVFNSAPRRLFQRADGVGKRQGRARWWM
jgi:membrane associated rhomboid family serine protease